MRTCCVINCDTVYNYKIDQNNNKTLFRFPEDEIMKEKWYTILNLPRYLKDNECFICSDHFEKKFLFKKEGKLNITKDAIPVIFASTSIFPGKSTSALLFDHPVELTSSSDDDEIIINKPELKKPRLRFESENIIWRDIPSYQPSEVKSEFDQDKLIGNSTGFISLVNELEYNFLTDRKSMKKFLQTTPIKVESPPKITIRQKQKLEAFKLALIERKKKKEKVENIRRQQNEQIKKFENMLEEIKDKNLIQEEELVHLLGISGPIKAYLKSQIKKENTKSLPKNIPKEVKLFAMNLNFYSPKGYEYVRKAFHFLLPRNKTLAEWYKSYDANAGFTIESFKILQLRVTKAKEISGSDIYCNLVFDEIHIRSQVEWNGKMSVGFVDLGDGFKNEILATQILVFMAVGINKRWKLPLGYFPTETLKSNQKQNLLSMCLHNLFNTGVVVIGVTFDGCPTNFSVSNLLGCLTYIKKTNEFTVEQLSPQFEVQSRKLVIIPDPCHMLKLIRNTLAEEGPLFDDNMEEISWKYLENLVNLEESKNIHLDNQLGRAHVYFANQKINVRLATQTLSTSVANALEFCDLELKLPEFKGCQATIRFIRIMNDIFDVLSSKFLFQEGKKQPLCVSNMDIVQSMTPIYIKYLGEIKIKSKLLGNTGFQPICTSLRRSGFIGMILCLKSIDFLYEEYIKTKKLQFIPFYKLNKYHLELFFGSIRSRLRSNSNPTVRQFAAAYKRLLIHTQMSGNGLGNYLFLDDLKILNPISVINLSTDRSELLAINNSNKPEVCNNIAEIIDLNNDFFPDLGYFLDNMNISEFSENIVQYIAGFIVFQLQKVLKCSECFFTLENLNSVGSWLIPYKNRESFIVPSKDVLYVCTIAEKEIRRLIIQKGDEEISLLKEKLLISFTIYLQRILIERNSNVFSNIKTHEHYYFLIKIILNEYLNIRFYYIAKKTKKSISIRNKLNQLILKNIK